MQFVINHKLRFNQAEPITARIAICNQLEESLIFIDKKNEADEKGETCTDDKSNLIIRPK